MSKSQLYIIALTLMALCFLTTLGAMAVLNYRITATQHQINELWEVNTATHAELQALTMRQLNMQYKDIQKDDR